MENFNRKAHWEHIYQTKALTEVSWYQPTPETSLDFFQQHSIPFTAKIIDIGGGDSFLVDALLNLGYQDITVLDISATAIQRAKNRLGANAAKVKWIVADAANFTPPETYDFWHDRAAFHFLTNSLEVNHYLKTATQYITPNGMLVLGTFSENGPEKCSGIYIQQYSEQSICNLITPFFQKINCITVNHQTPFNTLQNFIFCSFKKV